jgi:hypothetical protein
METQKIMHEQRLKMIKQRGGYSQEELIRRANDPKKRKRNIHLDGGK